MSQVKGFTVGKTQYNAVMASAVDQDKLLSLLTGAVVERAMVAARSGLELDDAVIVPMFMAMGQAVKGQVAEILMGRVVLNGTEQLVSVSDFGGRMVEYNTLLAQLLRWNLSDFFAWLPSVLSGARADQPVSAAR